MYWIIRDSNFEATKFYFDMIEESIIMAGYEVRQVDNVRQAMSGSKEDIYLTATLFDAIKIYFKGYRKIIFWFQGAFSEESFMKHNSLLRKNILGCLEKFILKKAKFIFFVSDEMKRYYSQRFNINLENKCYVMPCFNSKINKEAFMTPGKYENNTFCYAGSLSVWQGFDKILRSYKEIEKLNLPNTNFLILTSEKEKAQELVKQAGIRNFIIDYVPLDKLSTVLSQAKFGFVIRDNVIVNRVSTPTKLSTYMANGLIPIYSECLVDFNNVVKDMEFIVRHNTETFINSIKGIVNKKINPLDVYNEYLILFETYYNKEYHTNKISKIINSVFK